MVNKYELLGWLLGYLKQVNYEGSSITQVVHHLEVVNVAVH